MFSVCVIDKTLTDGSSVSNVVVKLHKKGTGVGYEGDLTIGATDRSHAEAIADALTFGAAFFDLPVIGRVSI